MHLPTNDAAASVDPNENEASNNTSNQGAIPVIPEETEFVTLKPPTTKLFIMIGNKEQIFQYYENIKKHINAT